MSILWVWLIDDAAFSVPGASSFGSTETQSKDASDTFINYDGVLIFGITLNQRPNNLLPTRSQLAEISRAFNREFYYTPVVLIFKYRDEQKNYLAFANTERLKYKQEWREGEKAGKVSLLRDIDIQKPHAGHERIIAELQIPLTGRNAVDSFAKLYNYWQEVFNVSILNKKFYQELSNWYFWAINHVKFPSEPTLEDAHLKKANLDDLIKEHNATNVIRLLTRLLFTWFIKEKKLVPDELFDLDTLQKDILKEISPYHENGMFKDANKESVYYKAILQNLFFASLNCPIEADETDSRVRQFRGDESYGKHRGIDWMMRYKKYFKNPDAFLQLMNKTVPFLNGGLFECLDDKTQNLYIDGFSDQMTKGEQLIVPDYLFFGATEHVDLSPEYGVKNKGTKQAAVKGLMNILHSYKFTVTENTPIEEDVALDPELLGKVFENLLASYNPETKTTARKQTGSFYTPREIVNYMVDESLIAYLKSTVSFQLAESSNVPGASSFGSSQGKNASGTFFNPNDEIEIKQGNLPHWYQKEVFYHVTFRLADSIPKKKVEELKADRERWQKKHNDKKEYTKEEWKEYNRLFNDRVEEWMNAGYGSCLLRKKENATIVANALKYFDGQRYVLDEWVVMPNHIHVLVKPKGEHKLSDILHSWKSYTANEINKKEGRTGQLWMSESFDHIVRNEDALKAIRHYIRQNPVKAGIVAGASSFGQSQGSDALDTLLHHLVSYDQTNPFKDDLKTTKRIVKAIDECKILDPACGSGAFPMGILQKMVHMLQKLDPENTIWKDVQKNKAKQAADTAYEIEDTGERRERLREIDEAFDRSINDPDYARKLYLIENSIYGVDIQPLATQISKLRFFISLVVDQRKCTSSIPAGEKHHNFGIRPLPNLETNFVAANTLIGIEKPKDQLNIFEGGRIKELETELKEIRSKLFSAKTKETKLKYRQKDEELRNAIAEELKSSGWLNDTAEKLAAWDPYDQNASSTFFDPEWMFDVKDGFDVVIGNPPYGVSIKGDERKIILKHLDKVPDYEIYYSFINVSSKLLNRNSGILSYIIPNTYLFNVFAENYRKQLIENWGIKSIIDFTNYSLFNTATVRNSVFVLSKGDKSEKVNYLPTKNPDLDLHSFMNQEIKTLDVDLFKEFSQNWALAFKLPKNTVNVVASIKKTSKPLNNYFPEISQGLIAYDKYKGQSQKIIDTRAYHFNDYREGLKYWLWGGDVIKYSVKWNEKEYIDYSEGIANPRNPKFFNNKRILVREITNPSIFAAITKNELYNDPAILIILDSKYSLEATALILNSKL